MRLAPSALTTEQTIESRGAVEALDLFRSAAQNGGPIVERIADEIVKSLR